MFIKDLKNCEEIIVADNSILREILHPDKADLKINYSLAHTMVRPGETSLSHKLKTAEVYYILADEGIMYI